ncbi:phospholipase C, phosphocholine-specific [Pedobacter sp. MR2016-19]|uniref:phosphocholine-specific phospholipase C n=1 Tax=Pedobacter sp. MR2016-19 TaxID=2780089 RepID=UPI0018772190|nr:phospholipase C, phosphocholine-specific [Pedobacter sp. MR2016-19]MBE5319786.1 phospholipase C, phosphocholine-specific [Pedobacter sp. MR2016-19]
MDSRRDFIKKAALLSGGTALTGMLPPAIQKALAINPALGSTFYDAEHVVFLMQENRSFDHVFGLMQGVRGFNDPRAIDLPNKNKVWLQSNKEGETYAPWHLDIKDTKIAWMGSTPHNWTDQTDARNGGKYNKWLDVKKAYKATYAHMPLTIGYCKREDFPFYYSLADAFTVCDQNFCSVIAGTHPNRYYWMTGTVRENNTPDGTANLWNISNYDKPTLNWKTYPERLEENGVSWKIYQNELTMGFGLNGESSAWLSNFGTNVIEYFEQYNVRLNPGAIANLKEKKKFLLKQIADSAKENLSDEEKTKVEALRKLLLKTDNEMQQYTMENHAKLSEKAKKLNAKAFSTNTSDPDFHELTSMKYDEKGTERELNIPKGDILHQFRKDVDTGQLPTVSWLMTPANFSDHPGVPWFGSWFVSEVMDILTKNPEQWKKTIFIMTYDENDGYFDHVPPFVPPHPFKENAGKVSEGLDTLLDYAAKNQQTNPSTKESNIRESQIGLGYRVPMVIVSPWTRGGYVCSEVFDHTSSLQFLETFIEKKYGKKVTEENISPWRRTVCGDLTSVFRPYNGEKLSYPKGLEKKPFMEQIYSAKFKDLPDNYRKLSAEEIKTINQNHSASPYFPQQEKGIRSSCALRYELYVDGKLANGKFHISFAAGNTVFGKKASGSPFTVYGINPFKNETLRVWDYTVKAGDTIQDEWAIGDFEGGEYHLRAYGPNGFFREFKGNKNNPALTVKCAYENGFTKASLKGNVALQLRNEGSQPLEVSIDDMAYKTGKRLLTVAPKGNASLILNLDKSHNWYDFQVSVKGNSSYFERFAGRVETGKETKTDPLMGKMV